MMCMHSISKYCYITLLVACFQCSPSNTKIASSPKRIGFRMNETILISPLIQIDDGQNEQLMGWANELFKDQMFWVKTINYWDAQYNSKQYGIELPTFNNYDSANFNVLNERLGIDFILLCTLSDFKENYDNELNNPNYQRREVMVSFQLLDLKSKTIVWYCTTRVFANPFKVNGDTQQYSINILSGSFAINKAYKESIKKLIKSITRIE